MQPEGCDRFPDSHPCRGNASMTAAISTHARSLALAAITIAATTAVVLPVATAQAPSPAPQLVVGLPDFTNLVEQVGPGVVNIEAIVGSKSSRQQAQAQM